jgi:hypothetical protein
VIFHGKLLNNQMVYPINTTIISVA